MLIRARNADWTTKWTIGIRGFRGLPPLDPQTTRFKQWPFRNWIYQWFEWHIAMYHGSHACPLTRQTHNDTLSCYHHRMTRVSSKDTSACYAIIICIHPNGKILERWTNEEIRMFEALFKGVSTRFGLRTIEKRFEKIGFPLLFIVPKSSFGEHNLVSSTDTLSCYHHRMTRVTIILWVQQTHYHAIIIVWLVWVRITARTHAPLTRQTHNDT
jgi:hypothetical protein